MRRCCLVVVLAEEICVPPLDGLISIIHDAVGPIARVLHDFWSGASRADVSAN